MLHRDLPGRPGIGPLCFQCRQRGFNALVGELGSHNVLVPSLLECSFSTLHLGNLFHSLWLILSITYSWNLPFKVLYFYTLLCVFGIHSLLIVVFYLFIYLAASSLSCGVQDLSSQSTNSLVVACRLWKVWAQQLQRGCLVAPKHMGT